MDFDQTQVIDDFELEEAESEEENKVRSKKIEVSLKKFRRIRMHSLSATITFRTFQRHSCWRALFWWFVGFLSFLPFVSFRVAIQEIGRTWGKISAQPHTNVKQICFPNGNVLF